MSELNLLYVHSLEMGYGRYGSMLAKELDEMGIEVFDDLPGHVGRSPGHPGFSPGLPRSAAVDLKEAKSKVCHVACWVSTPTHCKGHWKGQYPVMSTMWEATKLPESFRKNLHEFEKVIVPSPHNVELFSQYHDDVNYVPLGIDPDRWFYLKRKQPKTFFNFLIGGSGPRKGTDLAYKAFRLAWPKDKSWGDGPIPRLIMKSPRGEEFHGPRVEIVGGKLTNEDEVALYADAHCYLQPSRGEGFGLQPLQAIAQGIPTILTDAHGHGSFAHLGWGLSTELVPAEYFIYGDAGEWWEPSLDDLIDHMRWIYDNYEAASERASESATVAAREFTWRRTAERFVDVIGRDLLDVPMPQSGLEWHNQEQKKFLVITNKDFVANSIGATYQFKKGVEYWETAGVKRTMFEAGYLDPRCLEQNTTVEGARVENGLTEEQIEALGKTSASQGFCESCGQKLNSSPTRADLLFEQYEREAKLPTYAPDRPEDGA